MDCEETFQNFVEQQAREHAARNDRLWADGKVSLVLVQACDDPPTFSAEYQGELRSLQAALHEADVEAASSIMALDSAESLGGQLGEYVIPIAKYGVSALSGIIVGWLKARSGRKAKVEFFADGGPKKIEASTDVEVIAMLDAVRREARKKPKKKS